MIFSGSLIKMLLDFSEYLSRDFLEKYFSSLQIGLNTFLKLFLLFTITPFIATIMFNFIINIIHGILPYNNQPFVNIFSDKFWLLFNPTFANPNKEDITDDKVKYFSKFAFIIYPVFILIYLIYLIYVNAIFPIGINGFINAIFILIYIAFSIYIYIKLLSIPVRCVREIASIMKYDIALDDRIFVKNPFGLLENADEDNIANLVSKTQKSRKKKLSFHSDFSDVKDFEVPNVVTNETLNNEKVYEVDSKNDNNNSNNDNSNDINYQCEIMPENNNDKYREKYNNELLEAFEDGYIDERGDWFVYYATIEMFYTKEEISEFSEDMDNWFFATRHNLVDILSRYTKELYEQEDKSLIRIYLRAIGMDDGMSKKYNEWIKILNLISYEQFQQIVEQRFGDFYKK